LVLSINAAMFLAELVAGVVAHSTALIAHSADMLVSHPYGGRALH
jgi:Co/Zn/Cd efflux system component